MIAEIVFTAKPNGKRGIIAGWISREKGGLDISVESLRKLAKEIPFADIRPDPNGVKIIIDMPKVTTEQIVRRAGGLSWIIAGLFRTYAELCPVHCHKAMLQTINAG